MRVPDAIALCPDLVLVTQRPDLFRRAHNALLNEIAETQERIVLVLDDYQAIKDPEIHSAMAYFIERVPDQLRVVVVTREEPPFPLARWRASRGGGASLHRCPACAPPSAPG